MIEPWVFWLTTAVYVAITLYLAYLGWKKTKSHEDFLIAGRKVNPLIIGLSYGATFISTSAIVGFGGVAAQLGEGLIWLTVLNISIGILLAFIIFGKKARTIGQSLKAMTFPDLVGKRFNSNFIQYTCSVIILLSMPLYASAVLIGGARFIEETLQVPYDYALLGFAVITAAYVITGGILAVMYTDAFQGAIMMFGMTAILILTFVTLGGVFDANQALTDLPSLVPASSTAALASKGWTGWASMPELGSPIWYQMVTTIILGVGIGVLAQPQLVVRFMTAKSNKSLNRAVPIGSIFILLMTGVAFTVGALSNVYFWQNYGSIAWTPDGVGAMTNDVDKIIPIYINDAMPPFVVVIFMLTLLAAAMSTLSAIFHTMGSAAGYDLWTQMKRSLDRKEGADKKKKQGSSLRANQLATLIMIAVSIGLAFIMPSNIIAKATAMFMGLCAAAFLPMYTHGLFSKRLSKIGAIASLVSGAVVWFLWSAFVQADIAKRLGLCQAIFGKPSLAGAPWNVIDPLVIAIPASIIAMALGWYYEYGIKKQKPATA
ncbi:MAG: sodium:solute symporter family protein [Methanomassiliicoccales archaeon]|jgi:SSS family solute:Na+ symporter|nr:sodium:solute symporter family protein [Methanomassiliicoccales archaeon]MDD1756904.1 sodium:solute symporter family protein [Methanomassiliicoccales archaeon]